MNDTNPYISPRALDEPDIPHEPTKVTAGRVVLGMILFGFVSFVSWIVLVMTFFGTSSAYWPGFACALPATAIGFWVSRLVVTGQLFRGFGISSLLSALAAGFLLVISGLLYSHPPRNSTIAIIPANHERIVPAHWTLLATSLVGSVFGMYGAIGGIKQKEYATTLIAFGCGAVCIVYVITWVFAVLQSTL